MNYFGPPEDALPVAPAAVGPRAARTRCRIQAAALELFARDGFESTTVRAIAERSGLRDATLYYYFRSKRELLSSLWESPQAFALRDLPVADSLGPERLRLLVDLILDAAAKQDTLVRLLVQQSLAGDATAIALRAQTMAFWRRYLLPHFEAAFPPEAALLRADMLTMVMIGLVFDAQWEFAGRVPEVLCSAAFRERAQLIVATAVPVAVAA